MQQADIRYVPNVYDGQQGLSQEHEHELSSTSTTFLQNSDSRSGGGARLGQSRDLQGKVSVSRMVLIQVVLI